MNSIKQLFAVVLYAAIGVAASLLVFGDVHAEGVFVAELLPTALSEPDILKRWSQAYFRRVQSKIVFGEDYTGTRLASDGPRPSDLITAPPIVQINDLKNRKGTVITHTLINPLFPDSQSRLNYGRVKGQKREGSEKSGSKNFVKIALASWFQGVKEEDVLMGKQEIGMGTLIKEMVELLSDNGAQYMDDDLLESFFIGQSRHLYATIAKINDVADGSAVTGSADRGIGAPAEHPNTYAWVPSGTSFRLEKAASNSVADVHALLTKIDSTALPTQQLLNQIALKVRTEKIIGSRYTNKGKARTMVKVVVDPITMQMFRDDLENSNAINSAYQATGLEHPLIKQGDLIWGPLHICEEEKLLDPAFGNQNNFGTEEYDSDAGGADGITEVTASTIKRTTDSEGTEHIYLDKGARIFKAGTAAGDDANIGANGADKIGNIMVMGANSLAKTPGPVLPLIERTDDDYRRIKGLGAEHLFGAKRVDFEDASGNLAFNQSSLRIAVYRGG